MDRYSYFQDATYLNDKIDVAFSRKGVYFPYPINWTQMIQKSVEWALGGEEDSISEDIQQELAFYLSKGGSDKLVQTIKKTVFPTTAPHQCKIYMGVILKNKAVDILKKYRIYDKNLSNPDNQSSILEKNQSSQGFIDVEVMLNSHQVQQTLLHHLKGMSKALMMAVIATGYTSYLSGGTEDDINRGHRGKADKNKFSAGVLKSIYAWIVENYENGNVSELMKQVPNYADISGYYRKKFQKEVAEVLHKLPTKIASQKLSEDHHMSHQDPLTRLLVSVNREMQATKLASKTGGTKMADFMAGNLSHTLHNLLQKEGITLPSSVDFDKLIGMALATRYRRSDDRYDDAKQDLLMALMDAKEGRQKGWIKALLASQNAGELTQPAAFIYTIFKNYVKDLSRKDTRIQNRTTPILNDKDEDGTGFAEGKSLGLSEEGVAEKWIASRQTVNELRRHLSGMSYVLLKACFETGNYSYAVPNGRVESGGLKEIHEWIEDAFESLMLPPEIKSVPNYVDISGYHRKKFHQDLAKAVAIVSGGRTASQNKLRLLGQLKSELANLI
jgi:DNA-directed RNA polymerase specialized sigma24 family protein